MGPDPQTYKRRVTGPVLSAQPGKKTVSDQWTLKAEIPLFEYFSRLSLSLFQH